MLLIPNKVGALAALFAPFAFSCSFRGIFPGAVTLSSAFAFFLLKPLQFAGMSVASGTATLMTGSLTVCRKINVISRVISSNPEALR